MHLGPGVNGMLDKGKGREDTSDEELLLDEDGKDGSMPGIQTAEEVGQFIDFVDHLDTDLNYLPDMDLL